MGPAYMKHVLKKFIIRLYSMHMNFNRINHVNMLMNINLIDDNMI